MTYLNGPPALNENDPTALALRALFARILLPPPVSAEGRVVFGAHLRGQTESTELSGLFVRAVPDANTLLRASPRREDACAGRRPEGLMSRPAVTCDNPAGDFFAHVAHLEAASVQAFRVLGRELEALDAPKTLIDQANFALRDEVRHAVLMQHLALRFGGKLTAPRVRPTPLRALPALALDNVVEGCVRGTYGALLGSFQAERAEDREVRLIMRGIAADATRHASLAWDIAAWAAPQLTSTQRVGLNAAQHAEIIALRDTLAADDTSEELRGLAGLPNRLQSERLFDGLEGSLWRPLEKVA